MKTMLWKELRENLKWGVLAFLALILAEFFALSSTHAGYVEDLSDLTLCSSAFLLVSAFGCSAIGVALALVQILPELRRDQWAALLHRPVPRGTIFFGKVAAGLLLYFAATTLPFLASAAYVATPGQFAAPLVPGMTIPGLSDLFLGVAFYSATLLVCLDRGPWWGRRLAIGLSLVPLFIAHLTDGWPFLLPALAAAVYLAAAYDTMLANGGMQNRSVWGKATLLLVVLAGAETAVLVLNVGFGLLPQNAPVVSVAYTDFMVDLDGQVFIGTQSNDAGEVLTDMNGKVVTDPKYTGNGSRRDFCETLPLSWERRSDHSLRSAFLDGSPRNVQNYLSQMDYGGESKEQWYLLIGRNYFIGYDKLSRRAVGICDADGFKPPNAVPKPFAKPLNEAIIIFRSPSLLWSGTDLFAFNFPERSLTRFDCGGSKIYGAVNVAGDFTRDKATYVAAALENGVRLFDADGKIVTNLAYPHDPNIWSSLSMGTNDSGQFIYLQSQATPQFWAMSSAAGKPREPAYLDAFDAQGQLLHTYSRPDNSVTAGSAGWAYEASTLISPFLPAMLGTLHSRAYPESHAVPFEVLGEFQIPRPSLDVGAADLAIIFALDLALGVVALLCARRVGFSPRAASAWALFVACFGLPGLIAFRFASNWPAQARCPQCHALRPIGQDQCPVCQKPWPEPRSIGTEIFDTHQSPA